MRKIFSYVFSLVAIAGTLVMNSCSKDTVAPGVLGVQFISNPSTTAKVGDNYQISAKITAPEKIDEITINIVKKETGGGTTTLPLAGYNPKKSGFSSDTEHSVLIEYTVEANVQSFEVQITVKDKKGGTSTKPHAVTVGAGGGAGGINAYTAKLLGDQTSVTPSFFASSTGVTYNQADAKANSAAIDFVFGTGTGDNAFFIGAVTDESVKFIYNNPTTGVQNFATKNVTTFKTTTVTAADFDAIAATDGAGVGTKFDAGTAAPDGTRVKAAATTVGSVFGFQTAAGKKGLAKVVARTANSITLDVKVQK